MHIPTAIRWLTLLYCGASLLHFAHNAEYIAYYPNMPAWISREGVYLAWLAVTAVGVLAVGLLSLGWRIVGAILLSAYGALGLDGLGHYALALCSQHTWAMNFTIWFEVAAGSVLALAALTLLRRQGVAATSAGTSSP